MTTPLKLYTSAAQTRKANKSKYLGIVSDLNRPGWNAKYGTIEIGTQGHYNPTAPATLKHIHLWIFSLDWKENLILTVVGKFAINCSQAIFLAPWQSNTRWYNPLLILRGDSSIQYTYYYYCLRLLCVCVCLFYTLTQSA